MNRKIYLVKKDPTCKKADIEWLQLSGREFYAFTRSPQGKDRFFITLKDDIDYECDEIHIEATYDEYREWQSEYDAHRYLRRIQKDYQTLSLDVVVGDEGETLHEMVRDDSTSVEDLIVEADLRSRMNLALQKLSTEERFVIDTYYFSRKKNTDSAIARTMGISHQALNKKRRVILKKIFLLVGCKIGF